MFPRTRHLTYGTKGTGLTGRADAAGFLEAIADVRSTTPFPPGLAKGEPAGAGEQLIFFFLVQMLRQVILDAHLADGVQLGFQPVDMFLFVSQDAFQ